MTLGLDHVIIGVADLDQTAERFRDGGFDVEPGGRHDGIGTENAIVRLGNAYLELLTVLDKRALQTLGALGAPLLDTVAGGETALMGFALRSDGLDAVAASLRAKGIQALGPLSMHRGEGADRAAWRILAPGHKLFRSAAPFLIQWETGAPSQRSPHPNGAAHVLGLTVCVTDVEQALPFYVDQLGLAPTRDIGRPDLGAQGVRVALGDAAVAVVEPTGPGRARQELNRRGEGPIELTLGLQGRSQEADLVRAGFGIRDSTAVFPRPE